MAATVRPVFVLGTARSGTTWLANRLASHPRIAAVTAPEHEGIHESHLFSHTRHFFPERLRFDEFLEMYRREDYFYLTGLDADGLSARYGDRKGSVPELFGLLMVEFAHSQGAGWWLEKTPKHTAYWEELATAYPDSRFVLIRRDFADTLRSSLTRFGDPRRAHLPQIARKVLRYATDGAAMDRLERTLDRRRLALVRYEDLLRDPDGETDRLLRFLDLPSRSLRSAFERNSSYDAADGVRFDLSEREIRLAGRLRRAVQVAPYGLLRGVRHAWDRLSARRFPKYTQVSESRRSTKEADSSR
ncbi:MAG TPA: sulfotransferase [Longimicrobiales bacterium]|nr:sulfotransferase [Longimicrobiales bacterium]